MKCLWCDEELRLVSDGLFNARWVHLDGELYRTRVMTSAEVVDFERRHHRLPAINEMRIDDHVAMPVPEGRPPKAKKEGPGTAQDLRKEQG